MTQFTTVATLDLGPVDRLAWLGAVDTTVSDLVAVVALLDARVWTIFGVVTDCAVQISKAFP